MLPIRGVLSLYPYSSPRDSDICIVPLILGAPTGSSFCTARNHDWEEVKPIVNKRETDFTVVNQDPKLKRADIEKKLWFTPSTTSTVVGKRKAVEGNALIFDSKTKEAREAKHMDLGVEMFSWFKQQHSSIGHATKVLLFKESAVQEQLLKH